MVDGKTEKIDCLAINELASFLKTERAKLVVVVGDNAGDEFELDQQSAIIGRDPSADWVFNDTAVSRQHVAIEFTGDGFAVRDLGSTNGILVDGKRVQVAELSNGDRFQIGERELQLVIEERELSANVFELPAEA